MRIRPVGAHALLLDCTAPADVPEATLVEAWRAELWRRREQGELLAVEIVPAASTVLLDGLPDPAVTIEQLTQWAANVRHATRANAAAERAAAERAAAERAAAERAAAERAAAERAAAERGDGERGDGERGDGERGDGERGDGERGAEERGGGAEVVVPVEFDGPDLPAVAEHWGLPVPAVLRRLTGTRFRVAFCGFAPGFPYLTGLPAELALPRLATPRARVPAGSVALAGPYAGIYPSASPGGWLLVGRTELVLFDVSADPPARLGPGTLVRMVAA
ncbi:allophanate hydrolase subunit 1 [Micromonospora sp. NPDC048898]|uniref:5-oxoprolinase subunit B family protein n=1 Tax=Micromonospora sp. NPDC048898 TaxID=3364260 RepID=UPI0037136262